MNMKDYVTPSIELWQLTATDVITASNSYDNNYSDIDWEGV